MKNYNDYRSPKIDKVKWSANKLFEKQLKSEGISVLLNKNEATVIIRNHSNPTNEHKEERYVISPKSINIQRGDMIKYMDEYYIVLSDVDKDNPFYNTSKMIKCNHILKWIDKNGNVHNHVALINNEQLYTTGVTENKFIQYGNSKESILLPNNEDTQTIYEDMRLIINRHCWRVTFMNEDNKGLLKLMCEQDEFNKEYDDKELGIADYYLYKNTYDFKILNKNPLLVTLNNPIDIDLQCYKNGEINNNTQINYTISDEQIIKIENNKIIGLQNGNCTLEIQYANIKKTIDINVIEQETNNITIEINGAKKIAWGDKEEYTVTLKNNGKPYSDKIEFTLTDESGHDTKLVKIIEQDNMKGTCTIQANDDQDDGIVVLHCKDRVGNEETIEIEICSFWLLNM